MTLSRFCLVVILFAAGCSPVNSSLATSQWVYPGGNGELTYKTTPAGDHIMDFSYAGYMGGGVALPDVPVKVTVQPTGSKDDTSVIQTAISQVSAMPLVNGFRGTVLLAPGIFICDQPLTISASGVVLRGSGQGPTGAISTIRMIGKPHAAITVGRSAGRRDGRRSRATSEPSILTGPHTFIADAYVPSGGMSFNVADTSQFAVGDSITIARPVTPAWVKFMHMDDMYRDGSHQTWLSARTLLITERNITAISRRTLTVDVPLTDSFDSRYLNPPGTAVYKTPPTPEISQVGVEFLHIQSPPQEFNHDQPHFVAIRMDGQDCWMRGILIDDTMDSVGVHGRRITLLRITVNRSVPHIGASKPAEFAPDAGQVLLDRCSVTADNVFYSATGNGQAGPIVLLNCDFHGKSTAESHQRWSTGILYDNCTVDGGIEIRDRGSMGSGHGWTMGWGVVWNCRAGDYIVQNPPGVMNWLIGSVGRPEQAPQPFGDGPDLPQATIDSPGRPVTPQSLYLTQLGQRLGPQALKNIGY